MTEDKQPYVTGVVVDDDEDPRPGNGFAMKVPLQMPPGIQGMNLGSALLNQTRYWGYRRAINAYRKAVEDKTEMVQAVSTFYRSMADLDVSKVRWQHRLCLESGGNSPAPSSEGFDLRLIRRRGQVSWARSLCRGFAIRRPCAW